MDRTKEFYSFYESLLARRQKKNNQGFKNTDGGVEFGQVNVRNNISRTTSLVSQNSAKRRAPKGSFIKTTRRIIDDINSCKTKLISLSKYVCRKTLFDDQPAKINELTSNIKRSLEIIGSEIMAASEIVSENRDPEVGPANSQARQHAKTSIECLESDFSKLREEFKKILNIRTKNLNEQRLRKQEFFVHNPELEDGNKYHPLPTNSKNVEISNNLPNLRERLKYGTRSNATLYTNKSPDVAMSDNKLPFLHSGSSNRLLQQMKNPSSSTLDAEINASRSREVDIIEATVVELGQMYQNFSNMVAMQGQSIQRIDDNIGDAEINAYGAHAQLSKYYNNISSNRWLVIKVLAVIVVLFIFLNLVT